VQFDGQVLQVKSENFRYIGYFILCDRIMAVMLDTKYSTIKLWASGTLIAIYCIGIFLLMMNFTIYVVKQEKKDLENYIKGIFLNCTVE